MKVIRSITHLQDYISENTHQRIGFVPTMGYFHEGHTSLMQAAKQENDLVVTSVFVNPLQFGPNEDFDKYPRDEQQDILIAEDKGVDVLFIPTVKDMYPQEMAVSLQAKTITKVLCGRSRPGHFDGVVTVLTKLFNIIQPNKVYFGLKDAQQFAVVDRLIKDLNFPIKLVGLPTIREASGLAKSSRNVNLTPDELQQSVWLYKSLQAAQQLIVDGEKCPDKIIDAVKEIITRNTNGKIDYIELYQYPTLKSIHKLNDQIIIAIAVQFERARLIDNLILDHNGLMIERI